MRLKFLSFSNFTLLVALALSSVAAWYSIIGLTAIFAGAVIPVIIMGGILEIGRLPPQCGYANTGIVPAGY